MCKVACIQCPVCYTQDLNTYTYQLINLRDLIAFTA